MVFYSGKEMWNYNPVGLSSILMIFILALASCSGSRHAVSQGDDSMPETVDSGYTIRKADDVNQSNITVNPNKDQPSNISLNEMIQRLPGVRATGGQGAYTKFTVDGTSGSFMSDTSPLFVVNGRAIGTDYSIVYSMVDPKKVVSVSVLKGSDATIYGSRGANGVILIRTAL